MKVWLVAAAMLLLTGSASSVWAAPGAAPDRKPKPEPVASFSPTSVSFGLAVVGATSAPRPVTLSNTGDAPLSISRMNLSGDGFAVASNACGASLAPGASCTVSIVFRPVSARCTSAQLSLVANDKGRPASVELSGTGVTAPPAPVITAPANGVTLTSTQPSAPSEAVTVSGSEGVAGAAITILDGSAVVGTATTALDNTFSASLALRHGTHSLTATAKAGDATSAASAPVALTIVPAAPTLNAAVSTPGSDQVTASGAAVPGATVTVRDGTTTVASVVAAQNGTYSASFKLEIGKHSLSATQAAGGVTSASSAPVALTVIPPAPALGSVTNTAGTNVVTTAGTGLPGAAVTILDDGTAAVATATASAGGQFQATFTLPTGAHSLTARQLVDGETSPPSAALSVTIVPPPAPTGLSAVARSPESIQLTWNAVTSADRYDVSRSTSATGPFIQLGSAVGTSFTAKGLEPATTYYFRVSSVGTGGVSMPATSSQATPALLSITTATLPSGQVGMPYEATVQSVGGLTPTAWSLVSGSLPEGLSLDPATGRITGTPTTGTGSGFTLQVSDSSTPPQVVSATLQLTLITPLRFAPAVPTGVIESGAQFSMRLGDVSGGTGPYTFRLTGGNFPALWTLQPDGTISAPAGNQQPAGSYTFSYEVSDAGSPPQVATGSMTLQLVAPLRITSEPTDLSAGWERRSYGHTLTSSGGAPGTVIWSVTSSALPPGLSLSSSTGRISGTIGSLTESELFTFTVTVTKGTSTASRLFWIYVAAAPPMCVEQPNGCDGIIVTPPPFTGVTGAELYRPLQVTGGVSPIAWTLTSGSLPPGILLCPFSVGCPSWVKAPTLMGFYEEGGHYSATFHVTDGGQPADSASHTFSWQITPRMEVTTVSSSSCGDSLQYEAEVGVPYAGVPYCRTTKINVTGGSGAVSLYTYELAPSSGPLPPGLCLQTLTSSGPSCPLGGDPGSISGIPTETGVFDFLVKVTDPFNGLSGAGYFSIIVSTPNGSGSLTIVTSALPPAASNHSYSVKLAASGGAAPYRWTLEAGTLPHGLSLSSDGVISGTTAEGHGSRTFAVRVVDAHGRTTLKTYTLSTICTSLLCIAAPSTS